MATRGLAGVTRKGKGDEKQKKLNLGGENSSVKKDLEIGESGNKVGNGKGKEVRFKLDETEELKKELKSFKEEIRKECDDLKKEMKHDRKRFSGNLEEDRKKDKNWEIRLRIVEERMDEMDRNIKELKELVEGWKDLNSRELERFSNEEEERGSPGTRSRISSCSSMRLSTRSEVSSDRFSNKEVNKLKQWVAEKEKEERTNNIAIKGIRDVEHIVDRIGWIQKFVKERLLEVC